ncbi:uncharacterized protein LOC105420677 [Amborella trichopoda]|uniref:uncharacterized protein LOC105420677 n=1 Tax=Amborella trichopoda TaxID=13333 RepID=UPI0005D40D8B|nr:uncharacterized protein LOC105420677 [Amborella trichopoda]|eukprot:XP_011623534.1 uncharacterized protein LOC105420677 [Amborella trichopoda]
MASNNWAEFRGLEASVDLAIQMKCFPLQIESDSSLLVQVIQGSYKSPWALHTIAADCKSRLEDYSWSICHVSVRANMVPDALAKKAIIFAEATIWRSWPLDFLHLPLLHDVVQLPYCRIVR